MPAAKSLKWIFFFLFIIKNSFAQQPKLVVPIGHTAEVISAAFSPDGKKVITISLDGTAKFWEAGSGKLLYDYKAGGDASSVEINAVTFIPGNPYIIIKYGSEYYSIWDVNSAKEVWHWLYSGTDISARNALNNFDPGGTKIILNHPLNQDSVFKYNDPVIYKIENQQAVFSLKGNHAAVTSCMYTPDGKKIITASEDSTIKTWNAVNGRMLKNFRVSSASFELIQMLPDEKKLLMLENDKPVILDIETGRHTRLYSMAGTGEAITYEVMPVKYVVSPDGNKVAALSGSYYPEEGLVSAYDAISVWNVQTGKLIFKKTGLTQHATSHLFSPDSKQVSLATKNNKLIIMDAGTGKLIFELKEFNDIINTARYTKNGKEIITASGHSVKTWNAVTGKLISTIITDTSKINDARFSPDEKYIVIASDDHTAKIWDPSSGKFTQELKGRTVLVKDAHFNSNMKRLIILTEAGKKMLNLENGKLITDSLEINTIEKKDSGTVLSNFSNIRFSPDGNLSLNWGVDIVQLSAASETGTKMLRKGNRGLGPVNGRMDHSVNSVKFSPNSKMLVLTLADNTTRIFDIENDAFISTIILIDSTDFVNQMTGGYYQSSTNAAKQLHYITNDSKVISFEQLDVKYNRPDKVLQALGDFDSSLISSYYNAYLKRINKLGIDTTAFRDNYSVPEADFADRDAIESEQKNEKLSIHIKGIDRTVMLERFNVWINEVPLFGMKGFNMKKENRKVLDTTINITLSTGENRIETSVTNINGIESYRKPLSVEYIPAEGKRSKIYFIGIGINHFADSSHNLKWCEQDIRDLTKSMRSKYGDQLVIVDTLYNENATRTNIHDLKKKLMNTGVNDKVIISYSGHGLLSKDYDYYLSSYTVNFKNPEEGGIPYDEIENMLDSIPARKKILLLDACNSGEVDKDEMKKIETASSNLANTNTTANTRGAIVTSIGNNSTKLGLQNSFELMQSLFVNVGKGTGAIIISASGGVQFAQERSELGHGVFTYSVIEAMNKFTNIKVSSFKKYIGNRVMELTNGLQKPTTRNETIAVDWEVW